MKSKKYLFLTLIFVISAMLLSVMLIVGTAAQTTKVKVSPPVQNVSLGQPFSVNITVEPHTAIAGAQFNLQFDPSLLQVNSVTEGDLFKQSGFPTFFLDGTIDNTAGVIKGVGCSILGQANVSIPGTFAIIDLTARNLTGESMLELFNVKISDPGGNAVPIIVSNGSFTIPTPTPTPTPAPTPTPSPTAPPAGGGGGGGAPTDTDGDGLSDLDEKVMYKTDPYKADTDGGGVNDYAEVVRGTDPLDPTDDIVSTPTPSPTPQVAPNVSPSVSPPPTPTPTPPGFEAFFAIAGLLAVAYLVMRRRIA
jgi:PGF-CTERM protein